MFGKTGLQLSMKRHKQLSRTDIYRESSKTKDLQLSSKRVPVLTRERQSQSCLIMTRWLSNLTKKQFKSISIKHNLQWEKALWNSQHQLISAKQDNLGSQINITQEARISMWAEILLCKDCRHRNSFGVNSVSVDTISFLQMMSTEKGNTRSRNIRVAWQLTSFLESKSSSESLYIFSAFSNEPSSLSLSSWLRFPTSRIAT